MAKKVLVVDKDPTVQAFFEKTLSSDKFTLSGINDGISALDMLDKIKPDMILVEFALYGIDVFRFCEKVKQKNQEKERPIILTVGPEDQYDAGRLLSLGVMAILKKPLDPKQLLEKLQELSEETATLIDRKPKADAIPVPTAAPGQTAPAAQPVAPQEESSMKIEEMLGWSLPSEKGEDSMTQTPLSPIPPQADLEQTLVQRPGEDFMAQKTPPAEPVADLEQTLVLPPAGAATSNEDIFLARPTPPASVKEDLEQTTVVGSPPEGPQPIPTLETQSAAEAVMEAGAGLPSEKQEKQEKPQNGALKAPLNEDQVVEIVRAAAQLIIERVLWDVIPGAADAGMKDLPPDTTEALQAKADQKPTETPAPALELKDAEPLVREMAKEIIEKVAWDLVPETAGPGVAGSSSQTEARQVVEQIAKEIIEKVAWEVVPGLAEDIIKKELSKVKTNS